MSEQVQMVINEEINVQDWSNLLRKSEHASYFQSPNGYHLLKSFDQWSVEAIGCKVDGELVAVLVFVIQKEQGIKSYFSRRCIVFSGPVFVDNNALKCVLDELDKRTKGCVYLEMRNGEMAKLHSAVYRELGWKYVPWLNFIVDTTNAESMNKRISESRRRQLKKAEKNGVIISCPSNIEEVKMFYSILEDLYINKIKKPLPGYELFELFYQSDCRNYVLVYKEDKIIGGILCPFLEGVGSYEFYIAGLDQEYKDCYPSAMATYGAMKQANEMGLKFFDFMGGGSPDEGYGVREFKSRFGGEQVEWGRWLKVKKYWIYELGKMYFKLRSK
jgi:lipid II:glycine glycyltransferase (peptidoglycan interpeptide bridge formation enzyme)